ncbi:MAG TPA: cadmium resistance transporter [Bacteroidales bacterium]|nr:cadmium resistance transporter [Bacteroidales bacterium]
MEILIAGFLAFVSSNIDDLFILVLFYGNKSYANKEVILGQFLGIFALTAIGIAGSLIGLFIPQKYIGLLGIIPLFIGLKELYKLITHRNHDKHDVGYASNKNKIWTVAGVCFANGGDNIGIYIPLFATVNWSGKFAFFMLFMLMTYLWCRIAMHITKYPLMQSALKKYGHLVTPFVFILLGIYIILG